ncbi:MAG: tetratricopeptide repeat protein [Pirellulaceae bacterium]|nr:tetratricopeptide repeat protein [Pirellulaceae bacterium]
MRAIILVGILSLLPYVSALAAEPASVAELAKKARPSIVLITMSGRESSDSRLGTGFVISEDGLIATNLHVIGEARPITVQTSDGKKLSVTEIRAWDRNLDLAVLKVDGKDLPALELGDSAKLEQGAPMVALGNPYGLKNSVVGGVISEVREIDGRRMLQLAMPVEPGNSGGPVLDGEGKVVGIVTLKSLVQQNIAFAVEVNALKPLLEKPNPIPMDRWLTIGGVDKRDWLPLFGATWQQRGGRILVGGQGSGFGGRSLCLSQADPPELPYEVAVSVKLDNEAGAAGLVFHADGKDVHYGFYPTSGKLRLTRFDGPDVFSWKVLTETASEHYRSGQWNHLKVRVEKGKLLCFLNNELVIESTDDGLTKGRVGLAKFRETRAVFRRFEIGASLPSPLASAELTASLTKEIDALPALESLLPEKLTPLVSAPDEAIQSLRQKAKALRERALELEQVAADVRLRQVANELTAVLEARDGKIDLFRAALTLARLDEEEVEVEAYTKQLERMAGEVKAKLPADASEAKKLGALNDYLFKDNGFHGSRTDYYNRFNSYLSRVLDDREGLPITLSILYMELATRLGLKMEGVGLPAHFVVRHLPKDGEPQLIDVFDGGKPLSREDAGKKVRELTGEDLTDAQLAAVSERQILQRMLGNLLGLAQQKSDKEAVLRYVEAMLIIDPSLIRERGLRAILHHETGRREQAVQDLNWFLENKPAGIDLEQIREMQDAFRKKK